MEETLNEQLGILWTHTMIDGCRGAGLPEPEFREEGSQFVLTLWRDWLTEAFIDGLDLNERQKQGLTQLRKEGRIRSSDYQTLTGSSRQTATRDLEQLVKIGVFEKVGTTGVGTYYILAGKGLTHEGLKQLIGGKGLIKGSKGSLRDVQHRGNGT